MVCKLNAPMRQNTPANPFCLVHELIYLSCKIFHSTRKHFEFWKKCHYMGSIVECRWYCTDDNDTQLEPIFYFHSFSYSYFLIYVLCWRMESIDCTDTIIYYYVLGDRDGRCHPCNTKYIHTRTKLYHIPHTHTYELRAKFTTRTICHIISLNVLLNAAPNQYLFIYFVCFAFIFLVLFSLIKMHWYVEFELYFCFIGCVNEFCSTARAGVKLVVKAVCWH